MVKLINLKLNQLASENLEDQQMNALTGGSAAGCGCPCYYSESGRGSSGWINGQANQENGYNPGYSCNAVCFEEGGGPQRAASVFSSHDDLINNNPGGEL